MSLSSWFLLFSILAGQMVKLPSLRSGGLTFLDITVIFFFIIGLLKFNLKNNPLFLKAGFLFIAICFLSLLFTPLNLNLQEYIQSSAYPIRFLFYIAFAGFVFKGVFPQIKKDLQKILLFSGVGLAILGLLQNIFIPDLGFLQSNGWDPHYLRSVSTFLDPNFLGAYLTLALLLFFSKITFPIKLDKKIIVFILIYLALATTFSRSSYLAFLVSGLIMGFLQKSLNLKILVIVLFIGLLGFFQIYTEFVSKPRNIDRSVSANARINTWQQSISIYNKNPILGSGFNTYRYALTQYNLADKNFIVERGASSGDSSLLYVLSTTGIVGFVSYLFLLFSLFKIRNILLISALSGLLVHSIFNNSLFYPHIMLWIFLLPSLSLHKDY